MSITCEAAPDFEIGADLSDHLRAIAGTPRAAEMRQGWIREYETMVHLEHAGGLSPGCMRIRLSAPAMTHRPLGRLCKRRTFRSCDSILME